MSLLGDLARLAINLLPGLVGGDMFEGAEELAYTADELNEVRFYKANSQGQYVTCAADDEEAIGETYVTYENGEILYAVEWDADTGVPTAYNYLSNSKPVNTVEETASDYRNISLIRSNYVITKDQVFACLIKMLLNGLIDGCYWPEWATDIPTVLAYAMASLAAPVLPEGNYFARLDAYHYTGGAAPVDDSNGATVTPLPYYTVKNGVEVPSAALEIGAAVAAFYINAIFTFDDAERLTEVGTSLEQFVAEFLIWAADEYLPMLVGEFDNATGKFIGNNSMADFDEAEDSYKDEIRPFVKDPIWANAFNQLIGQIYSDFATRTVKSDANWDAIYTFIDNTLLKLIPSDWIPQEYNSTFKLFNEWLLNNILHFDLQGILRIFSVNEDESAELHQPVLTIVLRIVDRVLGLVFNGTPLLLPATEARTGANANGVANIFLNDTDITSLDALLGGKGDADNGSLPTLVRQLLHGLNIYKEELCVTILPLVMGGTYNKPYDKEFDASGNVSEDNWLGTDMSVYGVETLELYIDVFRADVNAIRGITYNTAEEAEAAITDAELQYIKEEGTGTFDAEGNEIQVYTVYTKNTYYLSAEETTVPETYDGMDSSYSRFTDFKFSHIIPRGANPWVMYEDIPNVVDYSSWYTNNEYRFFAVEDWKTTPYSYHNLKTALDEAEEYADEYRSFANNTLGEAYAEWQNYFVQTRLYSADLLDTNGDGRCVISTSDSDYVASTDSDPGFPVDDMPTPPTVMLPFYVAEDSVYKEYTYLDQTIDAYAKLYPIEYNRDNFEQLEMAISLGESANNNIVISEHEAEAIVRLAIGSRGFDITQDSYGHYEAGSIQWAGLSETQLGQITNVCAGMKYVFTYDRAAGVYQISRPVFRMIDGSYTVGCGVDACPPLVLSGKAADVITYAEEVDDAMYSAYVDFMSTMYHNRMTIYNKFDYISDRAEEAAEARTNNKIDTTMLKWALNQADIKNAYKNTESKIRNQKVTGIKDDGTYYYSKVYTQTSYDAFRKAYDYADCLNQASTGAIQTSGLTQSMVTYAFKNLLATYNLLVDYTGDADWTQLEEYINFAQGVLDDPNKNDAELGYEAESLTNLSTALSGANNVLADKTIDCERQQEVDAAAAELLTAINNLVYNSVPKVVPAVDGVLTEKTSADGAARTQGYLYGLTEGEGITLDLIDVIGMRIDPGAGNNVTVEDSGKGKGTGAFFKGTVGNLEKFRFYAVLYGDINGDTRIDGTDRTAIDLYVLQGANNAADPSAGGMGSIRFEAGDVNHNGVVDAEDSAIIELHYNYATDASNQINQGENGPSAEVAA